MIINSRIRNRIDTATNWTSGVGASEVLLAGEIGIVTVPGQKTVLMKIGDGKSSFAQLPWLSALASDVNDWAKADSVELVGDKLQFNKDNQIIKEIAFNFATADDLAGITNRIVTLENKLNSGNTLEGQIAGINTRLNTIEGTGEGSIKKVEADTRAYADNKDATLKSQLETYVDDVAAELTSEDTRLDQYIESSINTLSSAISGEQTDRRNADKAIEDKLGKLPENKTVVGLISETQQNIEEKITALANGAVETNSAAISEIKANLASAEKALSEADELIDSRLVKIEAFFGDADDESKGFEHLEEALDTLVEIKNYIDEGKGQAAVNMLKAIDTNTRDIKNVADRADTIESDLGVIGNRATVIEAIIDGYDEANTVAAAISAVNTLAQKGVVDAKAASDKVDTKAVEIQTAYEAHVAEELRKVRDELDAKDADLEAAIDANTTLINNEKSSREEAIDDINGKLAGIDTTVVASINAGVETAKGYTDDEIDKVVVAQGTKNSEQDSEIADIKASVSGLSDRIGELEAVDNATQEELDAYKLEVTSDITTAKSEAIAAAAEDAQGKVNTLAETVDQNTAAITKVAGDLEALDTRLIEVETFFKTAEGETIDKALDTLVEIQKYISDDDTAAAKMLEDITANTDAIEALSERMEGAEDGIEGLVTDVADVKGRVDTLEQNSATKEELSTVEAKVQKGIDDAKAAIEAAKSAIAGDIATEVEALESIDAELVAKYTALANLINDNTIAAGEAQKDATAALNNAKAADDKAVEAQEDVNTLIEAIEDEDTGLAAAHSKAEENASAIAGLSQILSGIEAEIGAVEQGKTVIDLISDVQIAAQADATDKVQALENGKVQTNANNIETLSGNLEALGGEVSDLRAAVAGGVHFKGLVTEAPVNPSNSFKLKDRDDYTLANIGDMVIYGEREFIYVAENTWEELGNLGRVATLESWKGDLNVTDASQATEFVTAVSQAAGKISVTRAQPTASDIKYGENSTINNEILSISEALAANTSDINSLKTALSNLDYSYEGTGDFVTNITQTDGLITITKGSFVSASTTGAGLVKLYDGVNSDDSTVAATAKAVKATYDLASQADSVISTIQSSYVTSNSVNALCIGEQEIMLILDCGGAPIE